MKLKILFIFLLFLLPYVGIAQNNFRYQGTIELGGDFGFSNQSINNNDETQTTFSCDLFIGFMAAKGFEVGFRPGFIVNSSDGNTYKVYNLFLNPAYNFNTTSNVYPYLGILIGYNSVGFNDDSYNGTGVGGEAGIKIRLQGNSMFLLKFEYLSQNYDIESQSGFNQPSNNQTINTTLFAAGFRIFLEKNSIQRVK